MDIYRGDSRLKMKVEYSKNNYSECIYCSHPAETREHVPSKIFLDKPFPDDLPTLPACYKCNNSFSKKELMMFIAIQVLKKNLIEGYTFPQKVINRQQKYFELFKEITEQLKGDDVSKLDFDFKEILFKLARGHMVWDLSKGYFKQGESESEILITYNFAYELSEEEIEDFYASYIVTNLPLPDIGCRIFSDRLVIFQSESIEMFRGLAVLWRTFLNEEYEYICYEFPKYIEVKIVISKFLFAKVRFFGK